MIFGRVFFPRRHVIERDTYIRRSSLLRARNLAIETLLKIGKIGIAITPRIITFNQRVSDRQKRGTLLFKTLFDLFRYDFRFPRYRRVKEKGNFFHFIISILVVYSDFSFARRLTDLSQTRDKRKTRFLEERSTHFQEVISVSESRVHS